MGMWVFLGVKTEITMEFTERWNLIMMNCDVKCKGTFTMVELNNKSVIDYFLINDNMYQYYESMEIDEGKILYDLSDLTDHVYMYVDVNILSRTTECRREKTDEVKYLQVKNDQLVREFVRKLEESIVERVEAVPGEQLGVKEYDSMVSMRRCAKESLQRTFKRRTNKNVKMSEPAWMTGELRDEIKKN